jgi:hypothetical protein
MRRSVNNFGILQQIINLRFAFIVLILDQIASTLEACQIFDNPGRCLEGRSEGCSVYNNWQIYFLVFRVVVLVFFFPVLGSMPCLRYTDAT